MSEPLQIRVVRTAKIEGTLTAPWLGGFTSYPAPVTYEVEITALLRSEADFDRWRALMGKTLEVKEPS